MTSIFSSVILTLSISSYSVLASTAESGKTYTTEDGTKIYYDDNAMNGGIDTQKIYYDTKEEAVGPIKAPRAPAKYLNVPFQTQQNNYYCGPASASMIVHALGFNRTQNQMASLLHTTSGGTDAGDSVARALNSVAGNKATFRWVWHSYQDINTLASHVESAINYGNAVMLNTDEGPGDNYLRGHNTGKKLYHFGVIRGYNSYNGTGQYMDPAYGYYGPYSGFVEEQAASWHDLSYASGGRGYAW